jgi:hypothetical protein
MPTRDVIRLSGRLALARALTDTFQWVRSSSDFTLTAAAYRIGKKASLN